MNANIEGEFYNPVILEISVPDIADVSAEDYVAKSMDKYGNENSTDHTKKQRPFVVSHPKSLKMKVLTWLGKEITWTFEVGKDPIPLKKIFATPAPVVVQNGDATETTVTSIQVGY